MIATSQLIINDEHLKVGSSTKRFTNWSRFLLKNENHNINILHVRHKKNCRDAPRRHRKLDITGRWKFMVALGIWDREKGSMVIPVS
jgi:hypothetical protein